MDPVNLAIACHSGFGHTAVLAGAVALGAREADAHTMMMPVDVMIAARP